MPEQSTESSGPLWRAIIIFVVGIGIGFSLAYYWFEVKPETKDSSQSEAKRDGYQKSIPESSVSNGIILSATDDIAVVSVSDQSAGSLVTVDSLTMANSGWVAIRENIDRTVGKILGAQRFDAGTYANISVELLRPTVSGSRYSAVLFKDDGDRTFNYQYDLLIERDSKLVESQFLAK
jgi:hypothetical protein